MITISDANWRSHVLADAGLIPRDFTARPLGYLGATATPFSLPLIPRSEWRDRMAAQAASKSRLSDIRNRGNYGQRIPSLDQDGWGYCWCHSSTGAVQLLRARANEPYVPLSAFFVGCLVKNYRDQGGSGDESLAFIAANGVPSTQYWPVQAHSSQYDTAATRANAALHQVQVWQELDPSSAEYLDQFATCLLLSLPVVSDFDWWGHSVCTMDLVSLDTSFSIGSLTTLILNSWGDSWSQNGAGQLQGRRALPSNAFVAIAAEAAII